MLYRGWSISQLWFSKLVHLSVPDALLRNTYATSIIIMVTSVAMLVIILIPIDVFSFSIANAIGGGVT